MRPRTKVLKVRHNNRKRELALELTGRGTLTFPYHRCDPPPTRDDPIRELHVDDELGREGVTYVLASGKEGSVVVDMVLDFHRDPSYMRDLLLHQLTVEARRHFEASSTGVRALARRLGTSPAQLYRLLDTTNYSKTVDRMVELLQALDAEVEVTVR
ncbi:MAG: hypothetical protein P8170_17470 [Gemmatimonadota bacterium]